MYMHIIIMYNYIATYIAIAIKADKDIIMYISTMTVFRSGQFSLTQRWF